MRRVLGGQAAATTKPYVEGKALQAVADYLLFDDLRAIFGADSTWDERALAAVFLVGKPAKGLDSIYDGMKLMDQAKIDELSKSVKKVGGKSDGVSKGTGNTSNKVNYGEQYTKVDGKKVLKPNIDYKTNEGYHYKTDSEGRILNAEATLQLGKAERNNYAQRTVGREDRLPNDDGGHLIASIFKGSGEIDNLVPMNATLNRKEYKALETSWKKALEAGKEVTVKVKPIYVGNLLDRLNLKLAIQ